MPSGVTELEREKEGLSQYKLLHTFSSEQELLEVIEIMERLCEYLNNACEDLSSEVTSIKLLAKVNELLLHNGKVPNKYGEEKEQEARIRYLKNELTLEDAQNEFIETDITTGEAEEFRTFRESDEEVPIYSGSNSLRNSSYTEGSSSDLTEVDEEVEEIVTFSRNSDFVNQFYSKQETSSNHSEKPIIEYQPEKSETVHLDTHEKPIITELEQKVSPKSVKEEYTTVVQNEECTGQSCSFEISSIEKSISPSKGNHLKQESILTLSEGTSPNKELRYSPIRTVFSDPINQPSTSTHGQFLDYYDDGIIESQNIVDKEIDAKNLSWKGNSKEISTPSIEEIELYFAAFETKDEQPIKKTENKRSNVLTLLLRNMFKSKRKGKEEKEHDLELPRENSHDSLQSPISKNISRAEYETMERCLISLTMGEVMQITKSERTKPKKRYVWVDTRQLLIYWNKGKRKGSRRSKEFTIADIRAGTYLVNRHLSKELRSRSFTIWSTRGVKLIFTASSETIRNDWVSYLQSLVDIKKQNK